MYLIIKIFRLNNLDWIAFRLAHSGFLAYYDYLHHRTKTKQT